MKPALLVVFVVVAVISGESAKYSYHHSTTGACARVRAVAGGRNTGRSLPVRAVQHATQPGRVRVRC